MAGGGDHVVRDVLHGYISFDDFDRQVIDTPILQRLRYIRQNDVAFCVFPSMNTCRFEHSLGVMHIAGLLAKHSLANANPADRAAYCEALQALLADEGNTSSRDPADTFVRAARWYGLLHDVGHLPFSHLTEHAISRHHRTLYPGTSSSFTKVHESAGAHLVLKNDSLVAALKCDPAAYYVVRKLLTEKEATPLLRPLKDLVDSDVDADRIDSTARDGHSAGGDLGNYDIAKLVRHSRLVRLGTTWRALFSTHAVSAIESLLVERWKTHKWVHYHPMVVNMKNVFRACIQALDLSPKKRKMQWHADHTQTTTSAETSTWTTPRC